ncbi:hypothetical protein ACOSQ3_018460 [Xanthoceras sorbifolium]
MGIQWISTSILQFVYFLLPHLLLGLSCQIIKIQLLADLNLKKAPQLVELVEDSIERNDMMWRSFWQVTNFPSDLKDGEAYAHLPNAPAPEYSSPSTLDTKDPTERETWFLSRQRN